MIDPIRALAPALAQRAGKTTVSPPANGSFAQALTRAQGAHAPMKFSAHAQQRLSDRHIQLSDADRKRIAESTDLAAAKGSREALILTDRMAFVVAVPQRVVKTVMESNAKDPAVFTNIDSVIVMPPKGRA